MTPGWRDRAGRRRWRSLARGGAAAAALATASYAAYVAVAWLRYGRAARPAPDQADPLLDRFMPIYEVAERHHVRVAAPAPITFATASNMYLMRSWPVRLIFRARERIMGAAPTAAGSSEPFLSFAKSIGWGVLADVPDAEIVMGAVTQPWLADVVFRPLRADEFVRFAEPGFVKIAWTLRADPTPDGGSIFRTETRVVATDAAARAKFRRYWSLASPGIVLIRWLMLNPVRHAAEWRARALRRSPVQWR